MLATCLAGGESAARLRLYLKKLAVETWEYLNWLTHARNAVRMDAEIGLKAVEHLLGVFTAARLRLSRTSTRCPECGSYQVIAGVCGHCGWGDPDHEPPDLPERSGEERARHLAGPRIPSSQIATFVSPRGRSRVNAAAPDGRREYPPPGSSLALLRIPFVFTQDELLTTGGFISSAKARGYSVDLDLLQKLHERRLLVPLYRVSDTPVEGRRINVEANGGANARGWVLLAAAEGRLRDPADEGCSIAWPYRMPAGVQPDRWWNGFVYSSWQLFDLRHVI